MAFEFDKHSIHQLDKFGIKKLNKFTCFHSHLVNILRGWGKNSVDLKMDGRVCNKGKITCGVEGY